MIDGLMRAFESVKSSVQSTFTRANFEIVFKTIKKVIYNVFTTIKNFFFGEYGPSVSKQYLAALHDPVQLWQPPDAADGSVLEPVPVINPDIPLAAYNVNIEYLQKNDDDRYEIKLHATTPRLKLHSIPTDPESEDYKRDLDYLKKWYADEKLMAKYALGGTKTAEETESYFKELGARFKADNPFSAMMAYMGDKPVGMFSFGPGEKDGEAAVDVVINPKLWNKGLLTEAALLLFIVPRYLQQNSSRIRDKELQTVAGTARKDNYANSALRNLLVLSRESSTKRYADGEQPTDVYRAPVKDLSQVYANTERARSTRGGRYSSIPKPRPC